MLQIENINKSLGNFNLKDINLKVNKGEYFIIIGDSGAGKSMLLEIIAGMIQQDSGNIFLNNVNISKETIQKRNIGIVFQNTMLFPHMNVFNNIAFALKTKFSKIIINKEVNKIAEETGIKHILNRDISNLSGGEAQRVAIARTLVIEPDILLLDEPLSYLDKGLKKEIMSVLRNINKKGQTIIHVSHDYEEALALANRIVLINNGRIVQKGNPGEVFYKPKSEFIANFIGIKNYFKGKLINSNNNSAFKTFRINNTNLDIDILTNEENGNASIIIPEKAITIIDILEPKDKNNFKAIISDIYHAKQGLEIILNIGVEISTNISYLMSDKYMLTVGKEINIKINVNNVIFIKG